MRVPEHSCRVVAVAGLVVASLLGHGQAQRANDEPDPVLKASALLTPAQLAGPHHKVEDGVATTAFYHEFTITSEYGAFAAVGRSQLATRLQEIAAIAALKDVSKSEVFVKAAGQSVANVATGVASAVTDPGATAKGIGSGVKRVGVNLGRRTKRAVDDATSDDPKPEGEAKDEGGNAATGAAKSVMGVNGSMRRWAQKVGVDPYTTNVALQQALESIANVDVAGGIAAKVVVPIPVVVSTTADVGNLVWGKDPEELRKFNEARAREIGVSQDAAKALFGSRVYTLTLQTRLVAALHAVRVPGGADYVASAVEATGEREALFFVESAEMLEALHKQSRVAAVLTDSRAMVARMPTGEVIALLPLDWVRYSEASAATLREIAARAQAELGATSLRLRVTGQLTERAAQEYAALGWKQ